MTNVTEQSFSEAPTIDSAASRRSRHLHNAIPAPIWRFRPTLQPVKVVKSIIPRIVLALRSTPASKANPDVEEQSAVERFAALAVSDDDDAAFNYVDDLLAKGAPVESIFLQFLAPAAQYLGTLWESDAADFATVTIGVSRLQRIMRRLGERFFTDQSRVGSESILLTAIAGEQHSFGLSMVAEFFRRAGWNLCTGPFSSRQEMTALVHNHWFDVVGFSVGSTRRLDELKRDIEEIRRESRNRHIGIMLGGPIVLTDPTLAASLGADMMSGDATTAPQQAHGLIEQLKSCS